MPGETLAFDRSKGNCLACHDDQGRRCAQQCRPAAVRHEGRYPDRKDLAAIIFDETKRNPHTVMPPFGRNLILTKQEINRSSIFFTHYRSAASQ